MPIYILKPNVLYMFKYYFHRKFHVEIYISYANFFVTSFCNNEGNLNGKRFRVFIELYATGGFLALFRLTIIERVANTVATIRKKITTRKAQFVQEESCLNTSPVFPQLCRVLPDFLYGNV